jgi:hypothetical protein
MFAAIGHQYIRHGTSFTKARFPGLGRIAILQQTTFFFVSAPEVVPIKIAAFFSSRCTHERDYSMGWIEILQENNKKQPHSFEGAELKNS